MKPVTITEEMIHELPEPVQRYMRYTGVIGKPWIENVCLKQTGRFRQAADQPWMAMKAEQSYTTDPAGFLWDATFRMAGVPLLRALDWYEGGRGRMTGKLAGIIKLFDVDGDKLDQGAMLRYLSEMIWFPAAFLGENIAWEGLDDHSARVIFSDHGRSVEGSMFFDQGGRFTNFKTQRYRMLGDEFSLDGWSTPVTDYGTLAGLNLPVKGQAVWSLPAGDFPYIDLEIVELEYNRTA